MNNSENLEDLKAIFQQLKEWPILTKGPYQCIEEEDIIYMINSDGFIQMSMPKEDYEAILEWKGDSESKDSTISK